MLSEELKNKITEYATQHSVEPGAFVEQAIKSYINYIEIQKQIEWIYGEATFEDCKCLAKKIAESHRDIKEIILWHNPDKPDEPCCYLCCYFDFTINDPDPDFSIRMSMAQQKAALLHPQFGQETANGLPVKFSVDAGYSQVFTDGSDTWALGNALMPDGESLFVRTSVVV